MTHKSCTRCLEEKQLDEFYRCARMKSGYKSHCKNCTKETQQVHCSTCMITMWQSKYGQHLRSIKHQHAMHGKPVLKQKQCPRCSTVKQISEFYTDRSKANGRQSQCKKCQCAVARRKKQRNAIDKQVAHSSVVASNCGIE